MDGRRLPVAGGGHGLIYGKDSVMVNSLDCRQSAERLMDGKIVKGVSSDQDLGGVSRLMFRGGNDNVNNEKVEEFVAETQLEEGEILEEVRNNPAGKNSDMVIISAEEVVELSKEPSKIIGGNYVSGKPFTVGGIKGSEGNFVIGRMEQGTGSSEDLVKRKLAKELRTLGPIKSSSRGRCGDCGSKKKGGGSSPKLF
ncbi:hypothetical protein MA16_Dca014332 [Dendrobium catenatum]|uniref:Uncharacterized protein n=1 Tax=Dendrobium catenatum TaxID=906689 RepID=A0A2I0XFL6_9ASPA|nr:hypothetical protein MA16_Dca014332 [Dendrobium catenatum]